MRLTADSILAVLAVALTRHDRFAKNSAKRFRKFDHRTPYGVHPSLCALLVLHEACLKESDRLCYAEALCYHDLLEDTTRALPRGTSQRVRRLVMELTLPDEASVQEKWRLIWKSSKEARLLRLYDKVSSLLSPLTGNSWRFKAKQIRKLANDVERNFGPLVVVQLARTLTR